MKVIQVYAPTSTHSDDEVEGMYEDISKALHNTTKAHFNVVMGDFNGKVGTQTGNESRIGPHGYGVRNHRGQMLVNFLEKEGLFLMNSFFKKRPQRKWTWQSPDTVTKNEIDFIMTDSKHIFRDVSVINRFNTGSDHRLLRGSLNINLKLERNRLMKSTLRPNQIQIMAGTEKFQQLLGDRFVALEPTDDADETLHNLVETLRDEGIKFCRTQRTGKKSKLSAETLGLMTKRRETTQATSSERSDQNKQIAKMVRRDLRSSNTRLIEEAIERNRGSKVFTQQLGRSHLTKLKTHDGRTVSSTPEISAKIEDFYGQLYAAHAPHSRRDDHDSRATLIRHYTDDLPDISQDEIVLALRQLKNGKAPGEDGITSELLKAGGAPVIQELQNLLTPSFTVGELQRRGAGVWWCSFLRRVTKPSLKITDPSRS